MALRSPCHLRGGRRGPTIGYFALAIGTIGSALLAARPAAVLAQSGDAPRELTLQAGPQYGAGAVHRFFFGSDYRDLWTAPIEVEVLDLRGFAGGLTPLSSGGARQTRSLWLLGADRRRYAFRSIDKYPAAVLPPELRSTVAARVVEDQTSSGYPTAPLVVEPIVRAVGVLHPEPRVVVMPDDPALGRFREEFAGMLGTLEPLVRSGVDGGPSFGDANRLVGTGDLFDLLEQNSTARIDERAFLKARLADVLIGDWDRHRGQWRWARMDANPATPWLPIPEDRDQVFAKFDGFLLWLARFSNPQLVEFGPEYPSMVGLNWNGREVDRRLLGPLSAAAWDSAAAEVRRVVDDSVIAHAVRRLPTAHFRLNGAELEATLRRRRDLLPEAARAFYRMLAREADLYGTDDDEVMEINRVDASSLDVNMSVVGGRSIVRRRFDGADTKEIRIYLGGGDDRVRVRGNGSVPITVRVIGGDGVDRVEDESRLGRLQVYDVNRSTVVSGSAALDRREYVPTVDPDQPYWLPRDWGSATRPTPWLVAGPDIGLFAGLGFVHYRYGFRHEPYASRVSLRAGYATAAQTFRAEFDATARRSNSRVSASVAARASGLDILFFHGFGNETQAPLSKDFYKVRQQQYSLQSTVSLPLGARSRIAIGPVAKYATTDVRPGTFLEASPAPVYGTENFGQLGGWARLEVDLRDRPVASSQGLLARLEGSIYPELWDVRSTFGEIRGDVSTYVSAGASDDLTLALRVGGKKVWGTFPFHEAAFLGGGGSLRGFRSQRFAGDAALFGNAEMRVRLGEFFLLLPGDFGVLALGDVGRVFLDGESSDRWHGAAGGGFWFAFLGRQNTVSLSVARSRERTEVYARAGFQF